MNSKISHYPSCTIAKTQNICELVHFPHMNKYFYTLCTRNNKYSVVEVVVAKYPIMDTRRSMSRDILIKCI